ncbi:MAG: FecR family protein [Bacteroidia bacterium]|nr:FecR family protein [Bacteroidia bacterium]
MNEEENNNDLYSRWLTGDLTEEEKLLLKENGDDKVLSEIISTADSWTLPELKDATWQKIKEKRSQPKAIKIIPLYKKPLFLASAASILLLVGLFWLFKTEKNKPVMISVNCTAGAVKEITLSDNTLILLRGKSSISYDSVSFNEARKIILEGEAYFAVNRKGSFEVQYKEGSVKVLGTKFDIMTGNEITAVKCFEGKVQVINKNETNIIEKGQGIRYTIDNKMNKFIETEEPAAVLTKDHTFNGAPLQEVCTSLSVFYDLKFVSENVDLQRNFSGRYSGTNLDTALNGVFTPMSIDFRKEGNTVYLKNK